MPIHELAALGAAACWALTSLLAHGPIAHLGPLAFNRFRQIAVSLMLTATVLVSGTWTQLDWSMVPLIALSGLAGIFVGDTFLFATVGRLGPRRAGVLFALNAPMAAFLGWLFLGETLPPVALLGIACCFAGVAMAILFNAPAGRSHHLETVRGTVATGVAFGILAALGQATGAIIIRPFMQQGLDPFAASLLRVGIAAAALSVLMQLPYPAAHQRNPMTLRIAAISALTGFLGLFVGMSLLLFALSGGSVGIISTLSATSPALILPMLWLRTGQRPALYAWCGAGLVVLGMFLIFSR